ncbi:2-oxoacid:ferredoxin oxidoreductase subunit beta [Thermoplasma volcanium]|nr:2-oxoacid:ferredoxin oxidoreductase subunit beta [Thermoplasma volcanium]
MVHNFRNDITVDWCPGCGDFGILTALTSALSELNLGSHDVAIISGIGCSGKTPHYVNAAGAHTLHGRAIPVAVGVKLTNPHLKVIVTGGDGDLMSIGAGHLVAEGRRNSGITVLMYDNAVYGLTKGQAAPTLKLGVQTKSLARPNIYDAINPIMLAISSGYSFVARGFSFEIAHLKNIIKQAIMFPGSSFIDILQPCPTYNNINTMDWYKKRVYKLDDDKSWDPVITENDPKAEEKYNKAIEKSFEWGDKIPIGVFYVNKKVPPFTERLKQYVDNYEQIPPAVQDVSTEDGKPILDPFETFKDKIIV